MPRPRRPGTFRPGHDPRRGRGPSSDLRDRVREIRERDPHATGSAIARELGVSRERVRQLLIELGLPTRV